MENIHDNKRKNSRFSINVTVQLRWGNEPPSTFTTRDMSDNGLFIISGPKPFPPIGTEVFVKLTDSDIQGNTPWVKARVARIDADGIGIQLLD